MNRITKPTCSFEPSYVTDQSGLGEGATHALPERSMTFPYFHQKGKGKSRQGLESTPSVQSGGGQCGTE